MRGLWIAVVSIALIGCGGDIEQRERIVHVCTCEQSDSILAFVERSIGSAYNMSDIEDVIIELRYTGILSKCSEVIAVDYWRMGGFGEFDVYIRTEVPGKYDHGCWRIFR